MLFLFSSGFTFGCFFAFVFFFPELHPQVWHIFVAFQNVVLDI